MTADRSAAADTLRDGLAGRLDQLWGWAKAGWKTDTEGGEYYLMDVENVDTFTRDVLRLSDAYADAQVAAVRERIDIAIRSAVHEAGTSVRDVQLHDARIARGSGDPHRPSS